MRPLSMSLRPRRVPLPWTCRSCRRQYSAPSLSSKTAKDLTKTGPVRTRFAPSPTGYLHLGSLRTALFNYVLAKATGGQFLLRIEDTDQKRTVPDAEERLFRDLEWAGIEWDEGPRIGGPYGPYHQSQRTALYKEHAERLLASGNGYRCFCTAERLRILAEHRSKLGLPPDYDRACAHIPKAESDDRAHKGESHVVRLKVPDVYPAFDDLIYGIIRQKKGKKTVVDSYDDPVLLKSDGYPTYHLANVVDDHAMKITHVIRGSEWISSTPKHLAMYAAFGWTPPSFAHVGLLVNKARQKLSKRDGALDIASFQQRGIFPESLTNFVALLGWSHGLKDDLMSMQDLIKNASMKYTKGDTIVAFEKLDFLQKRHAARYASLPRPTNPSHDLLHLATKPIIHLITSLNEASTSVAFIPRALAGEHATKKGASQEAYINSILYADKETDTTGSVFLERHPFTFVSHSADAPQQLLQYYGSKDVEPEAYVDAIIRADAMNYTTPASFLLRHPFFFTAPTRAHLFHSSARLQGLIKKLSYSDPEHHFLAQIHTFLDKAEAWSTETLAQMTGFVKPKIGDQEGDEEKAQKGFVYVYLRWALSAGMPGPSSAEAMAILGKDETIRRLEVAREVFVETQEIGVQDGHRLEHEEA